MTKIYPLQLAIVSGTSCTITIPPMDLDNGKHYDLLFVVPKAQEELYDTLIGTEPVQIEVGIGGKKMPMVLGNANIMYSEKLINSREYRLVFGNDGMPGKILHFLCQNAPCCGRYNPGNVTLV